MSKVSDRSRRMREKRALGRIGQELLGRGIDPNWSKNDGLFPARVRDKHDGWSLIST